MRKILSLMLACVLALSLVSCVDDEGSARLLSFAEANSVEEMEALDGERVTIIGYMSTLSPASGEFMYLMNLPYQSCPFCVPNTSQLSNTLAVYAKDGDEFDFTDRAIQVTGIMDFGDYVDEFGYEYSYRIKDATYKILDTEDMSEELRLWQSLASTDVISEVYNMFDYVNFLCLWGTYTMNFDGGKDYLYAEDALYFIETSGAQYNYGLKEGYFDGIIATIEAVDATAFADLVATVREAEALCDRAYADIKAGNYSVVSEYSSAFGDGRSQYKMNDHDALYEEMLRIYRAFSSWLGGWEI